MPIYEYRCRSCEKEFEALRRMSDSDREVECPACGKKDAERKMSASMAEINRIFGGCGPSRGPRKFG